MPKVKEKIMNKILIICDGEKIILDTIKTVSDIYYLLVMNKENKFLLINNDLLCNEGFNKEILINPSYITLVKDITPTEILEENMIGVTSQPLANKNKLEISEPIIKSSEVVTINTGEFGSVSISKDRIKEELNKPFRIDLFK
nr:MAG: hypothetical protein [Bacteriophage sp.]